MPDVVGESLDRAVLQTGLEHLIACEGVAAVVLFGARAQDTARPIATSIWP